MPGVCESYWALVLVGTGNCWSERRNGDLALFQLVNGCLMKKEQDRVVNDLCFSSAMEDI